jgi:hypothetical protein
MNRYVQSLLYCGLLIVIGDGCLNAESPASAVCPTFPPVQTLVLLPIYNDAKASIPLVDADKQNVKMTAQVDDFLRYAEHALDAPGVTTKNLQAACAYKNLREWAKAGALNSEPKTYNLEGKVRRGQYAVGFDLLALKLKAAGFQLDSDVMQWLHTMNAENLQFWEHGSNRGNLRIWAAAAAALAAVLERDPKFVDFQNRVWLEAMAAIHEDGTIDAEMARGQRVLIYHMFSFSGTLVLRSAREALGYQETAAEHQRLKLLADFIGHTLCNPHEIEGRAQAVMEIPGNWGYRIPIGFGGDLMNQDWSRCGLLKSAPNDTRFGGDTRYSAEVLRHFTGK